MSFTSHFLPDQRRLLSSWRNSWVFLLSFLLVSLPIFQLLPSIDWIRASQEARTIPLASDVRAEISKTGVADAGITSSTESARGFSFDQIGVEADKQYGGNEQGIFATAEGARLNAVFQDLAGELRQDGLWLYSTSDDETGAPFRLTASAVGRHLQVAKPLPETGTVTVADELARFVRTGVIEEFSVSTDGIRQDFLMLDRPAGSSSLRVELSLTGATVQAADQLGDTGVELVDGSGRTLAYSQLHVTDADGQVLASRMEVGSDQTLSIIVDDANARWPLRIDPTFTDDDWYSMGALPGTDGKVLAIAVVDDALYVGGGFDVAGSTYASRIAKWDGTNWLSVGEGINGFVNALAVIDSDLYVGGVFNSVEDVYSKNIAKWDGSMWSAVGSGVIPSGSDNFTAAVETLAVMDGNLYVGGRFSRASSSSGVITTKNIAKWDGSNWSALGQGLDNDVTALTVSDNDLYVGGTFSTAGGVSANRVAKWDGSNWSSFGSGVNGTVRSLAVFDGTLYAGGEFTAAGGVSANRIAQWDGSNWLPLGTGANGHVLSLVADSNTLYVGGRFTTAGNIAANHIARWTGSSWSSVSSGVMDGSGSTYVSALVFAGSDLMVGGRFYTAGDISANNVARWNGNNWSTFGASSGVNGDVLAFTVVGDNLYVGGDFTSAAGISARSVAMWDGTNWSSLGSGVNGIVLALAVYDGDLYAAGEFFSAGNVQARRIAKWNGNNWSALTTGISGSVSALVGTNSGLYVGGSFTSAGGVNVRRIAQWDGNNWSSLGNGLNGFVSEIEAKDGALYVGGGFTMAGDVSANHVASWDGNNWHALGSGTDSFVRSLEVMGDALLIGGSFTTAGGANASGIAKWNGNTWSAVGSGLEGGSLQTIWELEANGTDLYAAGQFVEIGGLTEANSLAKWDGNSWSTLGSGVTGGSKIVKAMAIVGDNLYVGGHFAEVGHKLSPYIARGNIANASTNCGGLVQEAENGERTGLWLGSDSAASNGQYVIAPTDAPIQGSPNPSYKVRYCFNVPQDGTYRIKANVYGANYGQDSFWVQVDGQPTSAYLWDTLVNTSYLEDYVSDRGGMDPVEITLTAGEHTVDVFMRERGARLDTIELEEVTPSADCGGLVQEAEDGNITGMNIGTSSAASGGRYVQSPLNVGPFGSPQTAHKVSYCFNVPASGIYRIKTKVYSYNYAQDSFHVKVNDMPASGYLWDTLVNTNYFVDYVSHRYGMDPLEVTLSAGEQVIDVYMREPGTRLDTIALEVVSVRELNADESSDQLPVLQSSIQGTINLDRTGLSSATQAELDLPMIEIRITDLETSGQKYDETVYTDRHGSYLIEGMASGNYLISIKPPLGYESLSSISATVSVESGESVRLPFDMIMTSAVEDSDNPSRHEHRLYLPHME